MRTLLLIVVFSISTISYARITIIPDPNFEQALIDLGIDSDGIRNGQVLTNDIETLISLDVRYKNISNLTGIEDFADLESLNVRGNNLTSLNTSTNTKLKNLFCLVNPLYTINISSNILLESLDIQVLHKLDNIDLSNNINLETLMMGDCWIDTIDISHNVNLKTLIADGAFISEIDLSQNLLLEYLDLTGVDISSLDVSNNILLKELYFGTFDGYIGEPITTIDPSNNVNLELVYGTNLFFLETVDARNGNNEILTVTLPSEFEGNPCQLTELYCVQVDDEVAATNNNPPYNNWRIDANFNYSEDCMLRILTKGDSGFSINPNPVKNELFLNSKNISGNLNLRIFNIEGKLLSNQSLSKPIFIDRKGNFTRCFQLVKWHVFSKN
ncbi:hypothetical protein Aeqsu_1428 [Aequorivita sublithincola DSM 14238]|uniref:Leucine Rich Repeat (LRR)-containing protein n=1 Tax=Aequorivita sublithincola (strain DSM 14238 / LMG 21431 / ACAM 643 / 9-3) TaxID=746697 RepID=I3YVA3_AEQSU|nr:hypothetical protein Aeqsu_1428 [Aequorivita sublithincola DSM 14238]